MDIKIRQGETLEITFTADDDTADTIQLIAKNDDQGEIINETANFSTIEGKRIATITTNDTVHPVDDYEYMLVIEYNDGFIEKLPDAADCEDDCDLPTLSICEAIDLEVS